jgi:hypothetical protein
MTKNITKLAGSSNIKKQQPTKQQQKEINRRSLDILNKKTSLEYATAGLDKFILDNNLDLFPIDNPFNANRLNEFMQSFINKLTMGNVGGGCDTLEGHELKVIKYPGLNKKTLYLNSGMLYFNGPSKFESWKEQCEYLRDDYIPKMIGIDTAIRCPTGDYLNFYSKINQKTTKILLDRSEKKYWELAKHDADPRMKMTIRTNDLLDINNFKLIPNSNKTLAKEFIGNTYPYVI